jgi:hypothetical protein
MMKFSNPAYALPVVDALRLTGSDLKGSTNPQSIWATNRESPFEGKSYVVKFSNHGRMSAASSAFELLGAWMAMELDLPVVEPALVNISKGFIETLIGNSYYKTFLDNEGLNFGSVYVPGVIQLQSEYILKNADDLLDIAKLLYAFDVFISNCDRGHQKPNIGIVKNSCLIYDHEPG